MPRNYPRVSASPPDRAPAKLLAFGEHTVLHGSSAYAVPLRRFGARLGLGEGASARSETFVAWRRYAAARPGLGEALDLAAWAREAPRLALASDIPQGYGLGSSGALTALVYRRYARATGEPDREVLARLEGFFHGRSSGLDPLVSLLDAPVVVRAGGEAEGVPEGASLLPRLTPAGRWFLLDSGVPRAGGEAIARFGERCADAAWRGEVLAPMVGCVDALVTGAVAGAAGGLAPKLRTLSALQREHLRFLIPDDVGERWGRWLAEDAAWLKLCGAGGGGVFLGYAPRGELPDGGGLEVSGL